MILIILGYSSFSCAKAIGFPRGPLGPGQVKSCRIQVATGQVKSRDLRKLPPCLSGPLTLSYQSYIYIYNMYIYIYIYICVSYVFTYIYIYIICILYIYHVYIYIYIYDMYKVCVYVCIHTY